MNVVTQLQSGELQSYDKTSIQKAFEQSESGSRIRVIVEPFSSNQKFISAILEESFGKKANEIDDRKISISLSRSELELLISRKVVKSIELQKSR